MSERSHHHNPAAHSHSRPTREKGAVPFQLIGHHQLRTPRFHSPPCLGNGGSWIAGSRRLPLFPRKKGQARAELPHMALFHCMVRHGTVRYGSLLGGFPLGTVPGTWYFFSTTSVEVPSSRTVTKTWRVNSADHWMAGENRHYCITELATRDPPLPARFKSAQPAKDRTQLLFKQTHIFASTTK